ncbi:uncharacterized protein [Amphiura filiformis]|uniref:uncharacterized protein n=1 Tax=Amphiura filiformis TaxID=82378 RepID=UPI003B222E79
MASNITLKKEGVVVKVEKKRHILKDEWKTSQCYAELQENLSTSKHVINLYSCEGNKRGSKLKERIELTSLQQISKESTFTIEKHRFDNYICIENSNKCLIFLRFNTSNEREDWYNAIIDALTPGINTPQRSRSVNQPRNVLKRGRIPPRNVVSEPIGSGSGFCEHILDDTKSKINATPVLTEEFDSTRDDTRACCARPQHRYDDEFDPQKEYLNVHDVGTTEEEWRCRVQRNKKLVGAHNDVYQDFHDLVKMQTQHPNHEEACPQLPKKTQRQSTTTMTPSTKPKESTGSLAENDGHVYQNCKKCSKQPDKQSSTDTNSTNNQSCAPESRVPSSEDGVPQMRHAQSSNFEPNNTKSEQQDAQINVNGNDNMTVHQGASSVLNLYPITIKLDLSAEVVDKSQSPPKKKQKTTSKLLKHLKRESSSEGCSRGEASCPNCQSYREQVSHLCQQNQTLQNQNQSLQTQNQTLQNRNQTLQDTFLNRVGMLFREKYGAMHEDTQSGSIVFKLKFSNKADLERFWKSYRSGQLAKELSQLLLESDLVDLQEHTGKLGIQLNIDESKYRDGLKELDRSSSNGLSSSPEENKEDIYVIQTIGDLGQKDTKPEAPIPAKRMCVCSSMTNSAITDEDVSYEAVSPGTVNQQEGDLYEDLIINDVTTNYQPIPDTPQSPMITTNIRKPVMGAELGACSNHSYDDYAELNFGSRLKSVLASAALEDSQEVQACQSETHYIERYNVEETTSNAINDHPMFEVNDGFLEYNKCEQDKTFKRRIRLDELKDVQINHYENIICLRSKHGIEFLNLQIQSRNEVEGYYNKLRSELKRAGWRGLRSATTVDEVETGVSRPRSISSTKLCKRSRLTRTSFSGYGFEGGFTSDTSSNHTQPQDAAIYTSPDINQSEETLKVHHLIAKIDDNGGVPYGSDSRVVSKDRKHKLPLKQPGSGERCSIHHLSSWISANSKTRHGKKKTRRTTTSKAQTEEAKPSKITEIIKKCIINTYNTLITIQRT